ncbi:MAG: ATP-binding protein [Ferruginibacter sp.]
MKFIGEDDGIFYCISEVGNIIGFSCGDNVKAKEFMPWVPGYYNKSLYASSVSQNIIDHLVAFSIDHSVYVVNLKEEKVKYDSLLIPNFYSYTLWMHSNNEVVYSKIEDNGAINQERYNFTTGKKQTLTNKLATGTNSFRSRIYTWNGKPIVSHFNHLYETNADRDSVIHELVDFKNNPIAGISSITRIVDDHLGNLYLQTINDGFRKIIRNSYPIKYYGVDKREDNYILSVLPDKKNNRILAGTYASGVIIFDTLQRLVKHIKTFTGEDKSFGVNCIIKKTDGDYILTTMGDKMWLLSKDLSTLKPLPIMPSMKSKKADISYFANKIFSNEEMAIVKSQVRLYHINFKTNFIKEYNSNVRTDMSGVLFRGSIIIYADESLVLFDTSSFVEKRRVPFKGTGSVRCFLKTGENTLYIGSNKGIYKVDSNFNVLMHMDQGSGLPDECIYAMDMDNKGNIWCSTNKGICRINEPKNILQLTKEDGLQENEFNTGIVATSEDGELFFGGINGVSSFFPGSINEMEEKVNLFFTGIKINNEDKFTDTAVWNIKEIDLPYNQNSLSFDFIAMANNNPEQYIYQYKMIGVDDEWAQNSDLQTVHYFLPPGKYVFKIYASRVFNKDATSMKEIVIWIHPPFWKTWWFITGLILLIALGMIYFINNYNKRKYQKKVMQLESEHKVQLERERISRDLHDNIGAYANVILYKTDLLQKEELNEERNEMMNDLRFASKDIITSLRETIWALKHDEYSAQECLLRVRNFIQPFSRYYPQIHFTVNGEASASMILHYTKALDLVRIVQEAVSNSIKHSNAIEININSSIENNRWKLTISDNGSGFDYAGKFKLQQGNGLNNMKQRAADSGFDLNLESKPGIGTTIKIFV